MEVDPGVSLKALRAEYRAACQASNEIIGRIGDPDAPVIRNGKAQDLRWAILAVIQETARHAGHADIIRGADRRHDGTVRARRPNGRWAGGRGGPPAGSAAYAVVEVSGLGRVHDLDNVQLDPGRQDVEHASALAEENRDLGDHQLVQYAGL